MLAARYPTVGVRVAQAAAMVEAGEPGQALDVLLPLPAADVGSYQPYWVTLSRARAALGDVDSARQALQRAIGLTEDPAVRSFLAQSLPR